MRTLRLACAICALVALPVLAQAAGPDARLDAGAEATASATTFTLTIDAIGTSPNQIEIARSGARFVIDSNGAIPPPTGQGVTGACLNPSKNPNQLRCLATKVNGFDISTMGGNDTVTVEKYVGVPTKINGGAGLDDLAGGANSDRLIGGNDGDKLVGRAGSDSLYGGNGEDLLLGGAGKDLLRGNGGQDVLRGGPGRDDERQ